jgi:23S rRNA (cytidine1920-2'-O)/16S rRNA (cytidine1409-2'-O)-methyltransferase
MAATPSKKHSASGADRESGPRAPHSNGPGGSRRKAPLAVFLVEQGYFEEEDEARRWVMAGKVLVDDYPVDKPGMPVSREAAIRVRGRSRYASRGGYKLEAALDHFGPEVSGKVALDCGASSGGFTDCLLRRDALKVYAVDAGFGLLRGYLRSDPRVVNLERTNLGDLTAELLNPLPSLITLDLSYLSLTRALPLGAGWLAPFGQILALVKPLYEVESREARRTGRIEDPAQLVSALKRVMEAGCECGLQPRGIAKLALQPRHGVHEFIAWFDGQENGTYPGVEDRLLTEIVTGPGIGNTRED